MTSQSTQLQGPVTIGIAAPQIVPGATPRCVSEFARAAEAASFATLWVQEDLLSARGTLEPLAMLAYAAAHTDRMRLGVGVVLGPLRSPPVLAKQIVTIDHLSEGRLDLGVALGAETDRYAAFGVQVADRVGRYEESLAVMRALWGGRPCTFDGKHFGLQGDVMLPRPIQQPHPPLWFGGHSRAALARAARLGDAFLGAGASTTAAFAGQVRSLRDELAAGGRDLSSFTIGKRVFLAVAPSNASAAEARSRLESWLRWFYGDSELARSVGVAGSVDECVSRLEEVVSAGAHHLLLNPVGDATAYLPDELLEVAQRIS